MKAKELMIGDWVFSKSISAPAKIIAISPREGLGQKDGYTYILSANNKTLYVHAHSISPIAITPEILENNGFIEDSTNELHSTYHLLVPAGIEKNIYTVQVTFYKEPICGVSTLFKCWGPYREGVNDIHLCNLHYVHEMQHIFKLCGIEKTIEL